MIEAGAVVLRLQQSSPAITPPRLRVTATYPSGRIARFVCADWNHSKTCPKCGLEFMTKNPEKIYCGAPCHHRGIQPHYLWRKRVLERDGHRCVLCGSTERLEADHIKQKSLYPELINDVDNGRTLCKPCHKKTPTFGANAWRLAANQDNSDAG